MWTGIVYEWEGAASPLRLSKLCPPQAPFFFAVDLARRRKTNNISSQTSTNKLDKAWVSNMGSAAQPTFPNTNEAAHNNKTKTTNMNTSIIVGSPQSLRNSQLVVQDLCTQTSLVLWGLLVCIGEKTGSRIEGSNNNLKYRHQHESCLHMICNTWATRLPWRTASCPSIGRALICSQECHSCSYTKLNTVFQTNAPKPIHSLHIHIPHVRAVP